MSTMGFAVGGVVLVAVSLFLKYGVPILLERLKNRRPVTSQFRSAAEAEANADSGVGDTAPAARLLELLESHKFTQQRLDEEKDFIRKFLYEQTEPKGEVK